MQGNIGIGKTSLEKLEKFIHLLTNQPTPWSRALHDKPRDPQLDQKFPAFYGTQRFITAFPWARHLSLSWARSIQSMPPTYFFKIYFNIILPSTSGI